MSTKSLRNQLLAAIAMVLVATIALGSSTYAWFASNNLVKATDISVTARSDAAFLEITTADTAFTGSTITAAALNKGSKEAEKGLYPVTPFKLSATDKNGTVTTDLSGSRDSLVWSYTYSDSATVANKGTNQEWKTVGEAGNHTLAESAVSNEFYFRMNVEGVEGKNLKATAADFGSVTADIDKGVTVLLAGPNGFQVIKADGTITSYNSTGVADENAVLASTVSYVADNAQTTGANVTVYVYYDGENANVTTEKLKDILGVTVASITFGID